MSDPKTAVTYLQIVPDQMHRYATLQEGNRFKVVTATARPPQYPQKGSLVVRVELVLPDSPTPSVTVNVPATPITATAT